MKKQFKTRTRTLQARVLKIDNYQRRLNQAHANKLAREFVSDRLGTIHVSERENGNYYIIDGQHRIKALEYLKLLDSYVDCKVYLGMTRKDEADMFYYLNSFKRPSAVDNYNAALIAGHEREQSICKVLKRFGFRIEHQAKPHSLNCAARLVTIYNKGGEELLVQTMDVCTKIWPNEETLDQHTLGGFATLLDRFNGEIDIERLKSKVSKQVNPRTLHAEARALKTAIGGSFDVNTADAIVNIYNKGVTGKNRLPRLRK